MMNLGPYDSDGFEYGTMDGVCYDDDDFIKYNPGDGVCYNDYDRYDDDFINYNPGDGVYDGNNSATLKRKKSNFYPF